MRRHPLYTERILERVACFQSFASDAAAHHERLDGKGYHRGLGAERLSRPARILAVADIYEALTADRPYREAMPVERALGILREERGSGLCPEAVDALNAAVQAPEIGTLGFAPPPHAPARRLISAE
jgi:HD-GYP domain-containing protein (c-di-GMP phosphodiesterase class II)